MIKTESQLDSLKSLALTKEQLKIKNQELKKQEAERFRSDQKIRQILKLSEKRIAELQARLAAKEEKLRINHNATQALLTRQKYRGTAPKPADDPENKTQFLEKSKLYQEMKRLRVKNRNLDVQVQKEQSVSNRLAKEKSALFNEVKRLKEQARPSEDLITKITKVEEQAVKNEIRYKELLREKEEMIEAYNQMLIDNQEKVDGKVPSQIIDELRAELDQILAEKANLETTIGEYKKNIRDKIAVEKSKLQEVYKEKAKIVKKQKKNVHDFVAELIDDEKGAPPWVITFADMMTLLLTFFVVLYSISSLNTERFKRMILGSDAPGTSMLELIDAMSVKQSLENLTGLNQKDISSEIKEIVEENEEETLGFNNENGRIVIRIPGKALFEPGNAALVKNSQRVLNEIIKVIKSYPSYNIDIQGHTDDTPISTEKFPTNWELSSARATAVLRFFIDKEIDPKRLTATGFAAVFPLVSNETELGRSKNRRVEIVLEKEKIE